MASTHPWRVVSSLSRLRNGAALVADVVRVAIQQQGYLCCWLLGLYNINSDPCTVAACRESWEAQNWDSTLGTVVSV